MTWATDPDSESPRHESARALKRLLDSCGTVQAVELEEMGSQYPRVAFCTATRSLPANLLVTLGQHGDLRVEGTKGPIAEFVVEL